MLVLTANRAQISDCSASSYVYIVDVLSGLNVSTGWEPAADGSFRTYAARRINSSRNASGIGVQLGDTGKLIGSCRFADAQSCREPLPNMYSVQPRKNSWRQVRRGQ